MSLEMAHKVILPPKKNYIPQFLKQRDINSYKGTLTNALLSIFSSIVSALPSNHLYGGGGMGE
jgi:hypothetical protein